jgi:hypothetical protein
MQYAIENLMQIGKLVARITNQHYNQNLNLLSGGFHSTTCSASY